MQVTAGTVRVVGRGAEPLDLAWRQGVLAFRARRLDAVAAELDTVCHHAPRIVPVQARHPPVAAVVPTMRAPPR